MTRSRLIYRIMLCLTGALGLIALLSFIPTPYNLRAPGKAQDVAPMIVIPRHPPLARAGQLLVTTVIYDQASALYCLYALLDPRAELLPRNPSDDTLEVLESSQEQQMDRSQYLAKVAALLYLGYELRPQARGAQVLGVLPGTPATEVFIPGDLIVEADATKIRRAEELTAAVSSSQPGKPLTLAFIRAGRRQRASITPFLGSVMGERRLMLGLQVRTELKLEKLPVEIDIEAGKVSGASAGLFFALGIVDRLGSKDLTRNRCIAGTGTMDAGGHVGPIFGASLKIIAAERAGATIFLCPAENAEEARSARTRLTVIPVATLSEAIRWLTSPSSQTSRGS